MEEMQRGEPSMTIALRHCWVVVDIERPDFSCPSVLRGRLLDYWAPDMAGTTPRGLAIHQDQPRRLQHFGCTTPCRHRQQICHGCSPSCVRHVPFMSHIAIL
jgi:hypothetical protein